MLLLVVTPINLFSAAFLFTDPKGKFNEHAAGSFYPDSRVNMIEERENITIVIIIIYGIGNGHPYDQNRFN